jgi:hypothetical protein
MIFIAFECDVTALRALDLVVGVAYRKGKSALNGFEGFQLRAEPVQYFLGIRVILAKAVILCMG